jgi:hypothetical protein
VGVGRLRAALRDQYGETAPRDFYAEQFAVIIVGPAVAEWWTAASQPRTANYLQVGCLI